MVISLSESMLITIQSKLTTSALFDLIAFKCIFNTVQCIYGLLSVQKAVKQ